MFGDLEDAFLESADAAVTAPGAFGKHDEIPAFFKTGGDCVQAVEQQIRTTAPAAGGKVAREFQDASENGDCEQPVLGDGGVPGIQRNQQDGIQIRNMIAEDDGGSNAAHRRLNIPTMTGYYHPA